MDVTLLLDIGLSNMQATAYRLLVEKGVSTAPEIAPELGESRTNTYKVLDKLCELGLATKDYSRSKIRYFPTSPAALERLVQQQSDQVTLRARKLDAALPGMIDFFFAHSERPSIRYFQGKEGLERVFGDMLKTGKDVYLLRSPGDAPYLGEDFFVDFRKKRATLGITTYALTPDLASVNHDPETDSMNRFVRTWLPANAYTANVEWDIYGDKVALISYGEEAMATIIESPQIAESFRQVFELISQQAQRTAD